MNARIRHCDELYQDRKLGSIISLLSGETSQHLDLSAIPCPTHGLITDPSLIQTRLNDYFTN